MSGARLLADLPKIQRESKPTLYGFCPTAIPYQRRTLKLVRRKFDYDLGILEILLSGSYGSAKSVLLAHLAVTHCTENKGAHVAICRRALPDIKTTIFREILSHMEEDLVEGEDYWVNYTKAQIEFKNGSRISPVYWADRRYKRARSLAFSMVIIEEATENNEQDKEAFDEIKARLLRIKGMRENVLICATNPDSPAHWLYDYFIAPNEGGKKHPTRHVFYSVTEQNPYLDPKYIEGLRRDMDPKRARRYLDGEWVELTKDRVYYAYDPERNYRATEAYVVDERHPIYLSWDFNIGVGKPFSMTLFQWIDDVFHFFNEVVIDGVRTEESLEELADQGLLDFQVPRYIVCGDASGKHKDTRNKRSDYDIIMEFLQKYVSRKTKQPLVVERWVPLANPALRKRHNETNARFCNAQDQVRLYVYSLAPTLNKGFRLVELKKGGDYIEDDSKPYQHVTTAAGYGIHACLTFGSSRPQTTRIL